MDLSLSQMMQMQRELFKPHSYYKIHGYDMARNYTKEYEERYNG